MKNLNLVLLMLVFIRSVGNVKKSQFLFEISAYFWRGNSKNNLIVFFCDLHLYLDLLKSTKIFRRVNQRYYYSVYYVIRVLSQALLPTWYRALSQKRSLKKCSSNTYIVVQQQQGKRRSICHGLMSNCS